MKASSLREIAGHLERLARSADPAAPTPDPTQLTLRIDDPDTERTGTVRIEVVWESTREPNTLLTTREDEVARLLAIRLSNREIASRLGISEHTVRHHVERVLAKLGVDSRRRVTPPTSGRAVS